MRVDWTELGYTETMTRIGTGLTEGMADCNSREVASSGSSGSSRGKTLLCSFHEDSLIVGARVI
jgi:hypothetical protein